MQTHASAQDTSFRTMRTAHFIIYYAPKDAATAHKAAGVAEQWHRTIRKKLKIQAEGITPIYLYPDRRSFALATGYKPEESVVGTAHTRSLAVKVDASQTFARVQDIIPHELVHVLISRYLSISARRLPLYMHEGLAKYLTNDWSAAESELLSKIASSGRLIPLSHLADRFLVDKDEITMAYVQGYSIIEYLARKYGEESLSDILAEIKAGHTYPVALEYSIGITPEQLEKEWREYLWEKYGFERWIELGSAVMSITMAVLAVLAFRARWARKRLKAVQLEREQHEKNNG